MKGKLNGISLFSGYGGIDLALESWVRPIIYCDIDTYAQKTLLSRMDDGGLPFAPIWNDVTTLDGKKFRGLVDAIYGGFPCQDISVAGKGKGLAGKRSGLFREITRIAEETEAPFILLENVPGIRKRGAWVVQRELSRLGYDSRWGLVSASSCGANHERKRWFCIAAHSERLKLREQSGRRCGTNWKEETLAGINGSPQFMAPEVAHSVCEGFGGQTTPPSQEDYEGVRKSNGWPKASSFNGSWWRSEPRICRVDDGTPYRMDRVTACGNGVVPSQFKKAQEILMGIGKGKRQ